MTVLQTVLLEAQIPLEPEEATKFEQTRVLPSSVFEAGVLFKPNGRHHVPAEESWTGEDVNFTLEDEVILSSVWEDSADETEAETEEPEEESESMGDDD